MPKTVRYHFILSTPSGGVGGKGRLAAFVPYREEKDCCSLTPAKAKNSNKLISQINV